MDSSDEPAGAFESFPSFTKKYHKKRYQSIEASNPKLDHTGKTVIITGAAAGIGAQTAKAYAIANAGHIVLVARRAQLLEGVKKDISEARPGVKVTVAALDIVDRSGVDSVFARHAPIDVVVHSAGYLEGPNKISDGRFEDFWRSIEVNVKGPWNLAHSFLKHARQDTTGADRPAFIAMNSCLTHFPASFIQTASASYAVSKVAAAKLTEYLAAENPHVRAYNLHPGVVITEMSRQSVTQSGGAVGDISWDEGEVPAGFCLWLSASKGGGSVKGLEGKFLWGNWDVDELEERGQRGDFETTGYVETLSIGLVGRGQDEPSEVL